MVEEIMVTFDWEHDLIMLWPKHLKQKILELESKGKIARETKAAGSKHSCPSDGQEGYHLRFNAR